MSRAPRPRATAHRALDSLGALALALTLALALALVVTLAGAARAGEPAGAGPAGAGPAGAAGAAGAARVLRQLHFGVRLVDVPVDEAHNPRAFRYIIDFLPTGSVIRRRIMVINDEPRTARFTVYAAAAQITGGVFLGEAGHARNELTGWITVRHPSVTIGPGRSAMDLVTIRVPLNATRAEHYAVIWAEQSESERSGTRATIRVVARVGIRVYLAVGKGGVPPTSFTIATLTGQRPAPGQPSLVARVSDTGGRAVDLTGQLRLAGGPGGSVAGPFPVRQTVTLAPGQSGNVVFALPARLPNGPWIATVTLVSGLTTATARATVSFGGPTAAAASSWASPVTLAWGGGMLLGLLVIAGVAVTRVRRLRRSPAQAAPLP